MKYEDGTYVLINPDGDDEVYIETPDSDMGVFYLYGSRAGNSSAKVIVSSMDAENTEFLFAFDGFRHFESRKCQTKSFLKFYKREGSEHDPDINDTTFTSMLDKMYLELINSTKSAKEVALEKENQDLKKETMRLSIQLSNMQHKIDTLKVVLADQ